METLKKMKIAIAITTLMALAYAALLAFKGAPQETSLIIMGEGWANIPLPKEMQFSHWWNLLVFPMAIVAIVHMCSLKEIVGDEPRSSRGMGAYKHSAKTNVFIVTIVANVLAIGSVVLWAVIDCLVPVHTTQAGPLTLLVSGLVVWLGTYVGIGFCIIGAIAFFSWKTFSDPYYDESPLSERYQKTFVAFGKIGFFQTLPMILGMTLGYVLRAGMELTVSAVRWIVAPFKRIKISISKQA